MSHNLIMLKKGASRSDGPRTYIVFGVMRGGTSMIAGVMRGFGIDMGPDVSPINHESPEFALECLPQMSTSIQNQNARHDIWGWKNPNASDYLNQILPSVRNPHLICVFRDAVANSSGLTQHHLLESMEAVNENLRRLSRNVNVITAQDCPSLLISYEKAERHKTQFISEFSEWLGVPAPHDKFDFESFMVGGTYKNISEFLR